MTQTHSQAVTVPTASCVQTSPVEDLLQQQTGSHRPLVCHIPINCVLCYLVV